MKSNRNSAKLLSTLLALAMMASLLVVPANAANTAYSVTAEYNDEQVYYEEYPENYNLQNVPLLDLGVGVDAEVTVSSGAFTATSNVRPISMTGVLPNGTVYRLTEDGNRVVSLTTTNSQIKDDINVSITTTPHSYTITANSGPEGFKQNLGSTSNPTCSVSEETQSVLGNEPWTVVFTPNSGLNIKSLNIRNTISGQNIVSADAGSTTVAGTSVHISRAADGSVTASANHAAGDMFITALTVDKPAQYNLTVSTDGGTTSDVSSETLDAGATKQITFTTSSGYLLDSITITDGDKTGILRANDKSTSVNGHTYSVARHLDGRVVLSVPAITANVSVSASSSNQKAYLQIDAGSDVSCNYPSLSYLDKGASYTVRLTPENDAEITSVKIESATDSTVLYGGEYRFALDGVYYNVDTRYDSGMILYFNSLPGNLKITVNSKDTYHTITLKADGGADYEGYEDRIRVQDGSSETVAFVPNKDCTIKSLLFSYSGNSYRADHGDSYVRINGTRCPIVWESNGRVSVTLYDVGFDITVKAETDYNGRDYVITLETDGGANYTGNSSRIYVDSGNSKTVSFSPIGNYSIEELVITRKGSTYRAERGDSYITINGTRHTISWSSNGKVSITLKNITADMTVMAETTYDGYYGGTYRITKKADSHSTISLSTSSTTVNGNQAVTVTVTPDRNYYLKSVTLKLGSTTKTLYSTTGSFVYNGITYQVSHLSDGSYSIYFNRLPADLTVSSSTAKGSDPNWDDIVIPNPPVTNDTYHTAYIAGIGNGQFAPYRTTTRAEAVVMLTRAFYGSSDAGVQTYGYSPYTDVPVNAWYASYITFAYNQGILTGLHGTGGNFRPLEAITRAEYTELACRFAGVYPSGNYGYTFSDVPTSHWANSAVTYAASRGWVLGYSNGMFGPDKSITRAELVTLTNRVLNRVPDRAFIAGNLWGMVTFTDVPTSLWAYYDILEAANGHYCNYNTGTEAWGRY